MADIGEGTGFVDPFAIRATERYGGIQAVGAVLWLEHADGICFTADDGEDLFIPTSALTQDEEDLKGSPHHELRHAMREDIAIVKQERWLREFALRLLPLKIVGNPEKPPLIFNADLKVFSTPIEMVNSPGTIAVRSGEAFRGRRPLSTFVGRQAITFGLRFVPKQGEVAALSYYPGGMRDDERIGAFEQTPEMTRMQLHNRIYFELFHRKPDQDPPPLIAPHQF